MVKIIILRPKNFKLCKIYPNINKTSSIGFLFCSIMSAYLENLAMKQNFF